MRTIRPMLMYHLSSLPSKRVSVNVRVARDTSTIRSGTAHEIRALVAAGAAGSVSAFLKHAVGVALFDAAGWKEMLQDALQQTGGPLTRKERAWADALLSPQGQKRSSRKRKAA